MGKIRGLLLVFPARVRYKKGMAFRVKRALTLVACGSLAIGQGVVASCQPSATTPFPLDSHAKGSVVSPPDSGCNRPRWPPLRVHPKWNWMPW